MAKHEQITTNKHKTVDKQEVHKSNEQSSLIRVVVDFSRRHASLHYLSFLNVSAIRGQIRFVREVIITDNYHLIYSYSC